MIKGFDFSYNLIKKALDNNTLLLLNIYTSKNCNLECPYCFTSSWSEECLIGLDDYYKIISEAKKLGAESVWWVGTGEPFIYKYHKELIEFITKQDLWLGIFTNGTLLTEELVSFLSTQNVTIYLKLNSFRKNIQNKLVGNIDAFEKMQKALELLLKYGLNKDNRLVVESVITKLNYQELPFIYKWARENNIHPLFEMMEYANDEAKALDISIAEHVKLFKVFQTIDEQYNIKWEASPPWTGRKCRNLYFSLAVDSSGNVQPCSGLRKVIGNIRDNPLSYWWNHPDFKKFRDPAFLEPDYNSSKSLGNYGCKSHAFHLTGDIKAIDPRIKYFHVKADDKI